MMSPYNIVDAYVGEKEYKSVTKFQLITNIKNNPETVYSGVKDGVPYRIRKHLNANYM